MLFNTFNLHIEQVEMFKQRLSIIKVVLTYEVSIDICLNSFNGQCFTIINHTDFEGNLNHWAQPLGSTIANDGHVKLPKKTDGKMQ